MISIEMYKHILLIRSSQELIQIHGMMEELIHGSSCYMRSVIHGGPDTWWDLIHMEPDTWRSL